MINSRFVRQSIFVLCLLMIANAAGGQTRSRSSEFVPTEGQAGKDVIWVPTSQTLVDKMLDLAKITPADYLIDLGSGDGRLVISAAKRGTRALGIEYNPDMVGLSKRNALKEGVSDKAQFIQADIFKSDFSRATVITMFLLTSINLQLRPHILNLKPGTRIVSNTFTMEDWEADETATVEEGDKCSNYCTALLWVVPAKVEGNWKLSQGQLTLKQTFQMISGTFDSSSNNVAISNGRLKGEGISFAAGQTEYVGRVSGNAMEGTFKSAGTTGKWNAVRTSR